MARRKRSDDRRRSSSGRLRHRGPGAYEWRSRDELERQARRDGWLVVAVGLYLAIWILTYLPPVDPDAALGGAILQALGIYPFVTAVRRWLATRRLVRVAEEVSAIDQEELVSSLAAVDDVVRRLRVLVDELDTGANRRAGKSAIAAAERVAREQRRLLCRQFELARLGATRTPDALTRAHDETTADLATLESSLGELVLTVVDVVSSADDESISIALHHVRLASEQASALAAATREVARLEAATWQRPARSADREVPVHPGHLERDREERCDPGDRV